MNIMKKKAVIAAVAICLIISAAAVAVAHRPWEEKRPDVVDGPGLGDETPSVRGNTSGNITSGGVVIDAGDWIYINGSDPFWSLYRMRPDGSEKSRIMPDTDEHVRFTDLNLYDGTGHEILFERG